MWQKVVGRHGVNRAPILASILRVGRHILFENNKKEKTTTKLQYPKSKQIKILN
jgi:hypothetical protein